MNLSTETKLIAAGAAVVLIAGYYAQRKAVKAVATAAEAINPVNNNNIVYRGVNSVVESITGEKATLGTVVYDWLHPDEGNGA